MSTNPKADLFETGTSAGGSMPIAGSVARVGAIGVFLMTGGLSASATGSSYESYAPFERTVAGPYGEIDPAPTGTIAEAVLEIRRRSGLTWEELGDLFEVSRRSVHHWANGKTVSAQHELTIRRVLATMHHLDQGNAADTRALLLTIDAEGVSAIDFMKAGLFEKALGRAEARPVVVQRRVPLSQAAQEARRPLAPPLLLGADQKRPEIKAKTRIARAIRIPKATD